ncbi:amidohydrolase family protein, partial [Chloroflexota bacterium]
MYAPKIPDELWPMTGEERGYPIVDVHGHHGQLMELIDGSPGKIMPVSKIILALEKYFRHHDMSMEEFLATLPTEAELVTLFKKYDIHATPCAWVAPYGTGETGEENKGHDNDYIEALVKRHPDIFLGWWGSVDPHLGVLALEEAEKLLRDKKVIGLKFQQTLQKFRVNDPMCYPLWDIVANYNGFVQFHGGYTGAGTGLPGGAGVRCFKYTN